jgi:hypothetical protein
METPENVVDEDGGDESWEHHEASGLESSCFLLSADVDPCDEFIQLSPSSCGGGFLVNGVDRMICSMWRPTVAEAKNRQTPRAKGVANRANRPLGRSDWADVDGRFCYT